MALVTTNYSLSNGCISVVSSLFDHSEVSVIVVRGLCFLFSSHVKQKFYDEDMGMSTDAAGIINIYSFSKTKLGVKPNNNILTCY